MQPLHLSLLLSLLATPLLTPKTTTTTTAVTEAAAVPASVPTPVMALALGDGLAQAKAPHRLYSRNARSLDSKLLRQGIDLSGLLKEQKERVKSSYKSSQAIEVRPAFSRSSLCPLCPSTPRPNPKGSPQTHCTTRY